MVIFDGTGISGQALLALARIYHSLPIKGGTSASTDEQSVPTDPKSQHKGLRIEPYVPTWTAPVGWLPVTISRIQNSISHDEHEDVYGGEYISLNVAYAAISFLQKSADLLPSEPHIYASMSGDLVAEFETPCGNLTSIVSGDETLLFATRKSDPTRPIQKTIDSGSNQFREEVRSFTNELMSGSNGSLVAAR